MGGGFQFATVGFESSQMEDEGVIGHVFMGDLSLDPRLECI